MMNDNVSRPLKLFNSLTRQMEEFVPVHQGEARVYTCGPTVYNYQHIGNMRAYIFADLLGRTLSWKGYKLTHIINITDVGHLTSLTLMPVMTRWRRLQRNPASLRGISPNIIPMLIGWISTGLTSASRPNGRSPPTMSKR